MTDSLARDVTIRRREGIRGLPGQALLVWLALLLFAFINGLFRERLLEPETSIAPASSA